MPLNNSPSQQTLQNTIRITTKLQLSSKALDKICILE